ncbi:MAG: hypothetical protein NXI26_24695, partial [bacterium]|nr:hypothetical protein [bacterium]
MPESILNKKRVKLSYSSPRQDLCKVDAGIFFARKAKNAGIRTDGEAFQRSERKKEQVKMH